MKIIYFGSYWMGENDIVSLMLRCLKRLPNVEVIDIDPGIYNKDKTTRNFWIHADNSINWIKDKPLMDLVKRENPDLIICNAGGFSPTPNGHEWLEARGVLRVGIALSDPDDFFVRSKYFSKYFNKFFTNAVLSLNDYSDVGVNALLLPFAADSQFHRPLSIKYKHDVVVLGGARPDRVDLVKKLERVGLKVGCYGAGWIDQLPVLRNISKLFPRITRKILKIFDKLNTVHGEKHNYVLNLAPVYFSFAGTLAGYTNVKVGLFEAASSGACCLVQDFEEVHSYFKVGKEILTYNSDADAVDKALYLKKYLDDTLAIGKAARQRVIEEHTWEARWRFVLNSIDRSIGKSI